MCHSTLDELLQGRAYSQILGTFWKAVWALFTTGLIALLLQIKFEIVTGIIVVNTLIVSGINHGRI
jgi:hypothetical protein